MVIGGITNEDANGKYGEMLDETIALYTTIYPGVEGFLMDWYQSVLKQTDQNFVIWVGLDGLTEKQIFNVIGRSFDAFWVECNDMTPAQIRNEALLQIVEKHSSVVLIDSDDVMAPTRVSSARRELKTYDTYACAMNLMSETSENLEIVLAPRTSDDLGKMLLRSNVFGLSNSAYRTSVLNQCLPIPKDCILVDWFLATAAWVAGASMTFDFSPRMFYRQHEENLADVLPPYSYAQLKNGTNMVLSHYGYVLDCINMNNEHRKLLEMARANARRFREVIINIPEQATIYLQKLNECRQIYVWWDFVANPMLEEMWKQ